MTDQPKEIRAVWERTRALGQAVETLDKRLEVLEGQGLADAVAELAQVVQRLAEEPKGAKPSVWNWGAFNPQQQAQAWEILLEWMEETFRPRWPRAYREMLGYTDKPNSCWYQHPDMLEALSGLMASYHWAYSDPESGPLRVAEWLDRWLPGAVRQGQFILQDCTGFGPDAHKADPWENKAVEQDTEAVRRRIHMLKTGEVVG